MSDELREKAKVAFTDWHYGKGEQSLPDLLADFAAECVRAERERVIERLEQGWVDSMGLGIDREELWVIIDELRGNK